MSEDLNIQAVLGPKYEVVINTDDISISSNFDLVLNTQEPLRIGVGTGFSSESSTSASLDVQITAQENLNAYRAITYDGYLVQANITSLSKYAGVTRVSALIGESLYVVRDGLMTENGWSWTPNAPIFITNDGVLTQTQPIFGNPIRRIAWAISPITINLDPFPIIGA